MTLTENEWFIEAPWGRICIVAWGDCTNPPVLVCHGTWDCMASFRPLMRLLPQKFYYIGMELPGCGKSDPMPPGLMISALDLVYSLQVVVKHFRWKEFAFIGHSLGCSLGLLYNLAYPNKISKVILLDPVALAFTVPPEDFPKWYQTRFSNYFQNYKIYSSLEGKPTYTKEGAVEKIIKRRGLDLDTATAIMERCCEELEDGHVRFTLDPRMQMLSSPPLPDKVTRRLFTSVTRPMLVLVAGKSKDDRLYEATPYLFDESGFANGNFRVRVVDGNHDVHAVRPGGVATHAGRFLLYGTSGLGGSSKL